MIENQFRDLIRSEYLARCKRNGRYSLRAFARDLEIEPASLSRVLNAKQCLSSASARTVAEKLFRSSKKQAYFVALAEYSAAKKPGDRSRLLSRIGESNPDDREVNLTLESLKVISEWYHIAIMDLTAVKNCPSAPAKIAAALGIGVIEAKIAIERLLNLGLLKKDLNGRLHKVHQVMKSPHRISNMALRKFHREMIIKAIESIEGQEPSRRTITGVTMALAREDLERVNQMIEEFKKELLELAGARKAKTCLYQINLQFFDLMKRGSL